MFARVTSTGVIIRREALMDRNIPITRKIRLMSRRITYLLAPIVYSALAIMLGILASVTTQPKRPEAITMKQICAMDTNAL